MTTKPREIPLYLFVTTKVNMKNQKTKFKTINEYIKIFPKDVASKLRAIQGIVKKAAPDAQEVISYNMPAFKLNGVLVYFAGYAHHIGLYPYASAIKKFKKELSKYKTSKGTVQFSLDKPLPVSLIEKIISFRVKENLAKKNLSGGTPHTIYHKDGSIWAKGKMVGGVCDGYWEWFRKPARRGGGDGVKMRSGYFKKGVQFGEWVTYDTKGKICKITQIKN